MGWLECLRIAQGRGWIGELRGVDDWKSVPREIHLRAVFLVDQDGPVIRWGNPQFMSKILPGFYHDHLVCHGDDLNAAKSGWITVDRDGTIIVSG